MAFFRNLHDSHRLTSCYTMAATLLALFLALQLSRVAFLYCCVKYDINADWMHDRVQEEIDALPKLLQQKEPLHLALGSSETEAGFFPDKFDTEMSRLGHVYKSYNFGLRGINPHSLKHFIERLAEDVKQSGRSIDLVTLVFQPDHITKRSAEVTAGWRNDWVEVATYSNRRILKEFQSNPNRAIELAVTKYFFRGIPADSTFVYLSMSINSINSRYMKPYRNLWGSRRLSVEPAWDFQQRGLYNWNLPKNKRAALAIHKIQTNPLVRSEILYYYIENYDLSKMNLSPSLLNDFIDCVKTLQKLAKKVFVVQIPMMSNIVISEEGAQHLKDAIQRIRRETNVKVIDLKDNFTQQDYMDIIHLSQSGGEKYSRILAQKIEGLDEKNRSLSGIGP